MTRRVRDSSCNHVNRARRVTNLPDGVEWSPDRSHASVWVCDRRPCILDAMRWVEEFTGETSIVYDRDRSVVTL